MLARSAVVAGAGALGGPIGYAISVPMAALQYQGTNIYYANKIGQQTDDYFAKRKT